MIQIASSLGTEENIESDVSTIQSVVFSVVSGHIAEGNGASISTVNGSGIGNSGNIVVPSPIETSKGMIQPARGIKVTESGTIVLTAYRTNNSGDRLPEINPNCG